MSLAGVRRGQRLLARLLIAPAILVLAGVVPWADQASAQWGFGGFPTSPDAFGLQCPGRWESQGLAQMCRCPDGQYGNYIGGRIVCPGGNRRAEPPATRQSKCPDGTARQPGQQCAPDGAVTCGGGSFCPQGTQCKPGGGCSLLDSATMIGEPPRKEETTAETLDRIKKEIETDNRYDVDALQRQRERLLGPDIAWDTDTAARPQAAGAVPQTGGGAAAVPDNPELARLNEALSAAKDDLTHIRDKLQRAGAHQDGRADPAVERARQEMQSSAALRELSEALPPAQQRLESMKRDMAQQNPASAPTTAGNAAAYPPAAQVPAADARSGQVPASRPAAGGPQQANQGSAAEPAAQAPAPVQNTSQVAAAAQALMRNTPQPAAAGGFAPPGDAPNSVVQDWLAGRPVDPAKLPPDAQREYWERQALLQTDAQADAIRREQAAEDAYQGMFGQAARDNAQAERPQVPTARERRAAEAEAERLAKVVEKESKPSIWARLFSLIPNAGEQSSDRAPKMPTVPQTNR